MEQTAPHSSLTMRLFGGFEVQTDCISLPPLRTRKGQWLLALLVLRVNREVSRDWLVARLWPDSSESQARANLRNALYDLRQALGAEARRLVSPSPQTLCFDLSGVWCDLSLFDAAIARGDTMSLETAITLYQGGLLEGCGEEWVFQERETREQAYLSALETLAEEALPSFPEKAVSYLRKVVQADPSRQSAQRALMQALAFAGEQVALIQAYRDFRLYLHREMNAEPDMETTALFRQLQAQARSAVKDAGRNNGALARERAAPPAFRHLPIPLSSFIGRESEIESALSCLQTHRLVTLTGTGGIGKTRLSIAVAEAAAPEYLDGVWFVDLAPLSAPDLVPQSVAATLKISETPGRSYQDTLLDFLRDRRLLLLLDNCEHLLPACAALADTLLSGCPHIRILATSRQALGLHGELVRIVPSLSVPEMMEVTSGDGNPESLLEYAAIHLFVARAVAASPHFRLHRANHRAVVDICRHLDGIPLAIELAAARTRALSVDQIAARLQDRFDLLAGSSAGVLPRHQTLRATLDWSYALLSEEEKALLRRLSVFAGGCTLEAAEAICADAEEAVSA